MRDMRGGEKAWQHIKEGVPLRVEIGPRDIQKDELFVGRRDKGPKEKTSIPRLEFIKTVSNILTEMQDNIFNKALQFREAHSKDIKNLQEFEAFFGKADDDKGGGFAYAFWHESAIGHELLPKLKVTPRCIPLKQSGETGVCIFTGKPTSQKVIFAKSY
jgi:prolyl-tRNA synthetase